MSAGPAIAVTPRLTGMVCLRCEADWPVAEHEAGCPRCAAQGHASNLRLVYAPGSEPVALPYPGALSLGEGCTPLVEVPELAAFLGVGRVSLKLEWCNPSGSHKDRMSAQLMARALDRGATRIVAASSGNGGLSVAAYAARAGIPAEIATSDALPASYRRAIEAHGATLVGFSDSMARWHHLARRVVDDSAFAATNYRLPAVGTNPFGIEGYKMVAAEIAAVALPDLVVAPSSRGDLLSGLHLGFAELGRGMPRLVAAEPFPRLARVLAGADYRETFAGDTAQFSIAGSTVTWQAVKALRESGGLAVPVDDEAATLARAKLAGLGFHVELSAASALAALGRLAEDGRLAGRHAVLVLTGSGFRDITNGVLADSPPQRDRRPARASAQPAQTGASPGPTIQQRDNG
ncbi:pyridoxal-phosphate dependent enzyme [Bosea sp. 124]|uniref:pyridoxal-phosphate dependent enzyme n=1 Tax=Bosea sp. 124 TaxID=2135642 RepID=UPI000D4D0B24|nr:pyridoxal-phosphate dependent enzyme [Bosea sp. 124]PTM40055.1 L-threonine synthase [Bosea sp. 124]